MKLHLSEKQLTNLLQILSEDGASPSATPSGDTTATGASSKQTGGSGYPAVGKWESGLQRGAANQIAVTKWADVVGSKINRGKANQLKEQGFGTGTGQSFINPVTVFSPAYAAAKEQLKDESLGKFLKKSNALMIPTPPGLYKSNNILIPKSVGNNVTKYQLFDYDDGGDKLVNSFFKDWYNTEWEKYIPNPRDLSEVLPSGTLRNFTINGTSYTIRIERISDNNPVYYKFIGYYDQKTDAPYKPSLYFNQKDIPYINAYHEKTLFEKYGNDVLLISSFIAGFFFPGAWMGPILLGINLAAATNSLLQGEEADAMMFLIFAFLPEIKYGLGLREITEGEAVQLAKAFEGVTGEEAIKATFNQLPTKLRDKAMKVLRKSPEAVAKEIDKAINKGVSKLTQEQGKNLVTELNTMIKKKLVDPRSARNWKQKLSGFAVGAGKLGGELTVIYAIDKTLNAIVDKIKGTKPELAKSIDQLTAEWMSQKQEITNAGLNEKYERLAKHLLYDILPKYKQTFGENGEYKFYEAIIRVTAKFIQNQDQDFSVVINDIYNEQKNEK